MVIEIVFKPLLSFLISLPELFLLFYALLLGLGTADYLRTVVQELGQTLDELHFLFVGQLSLDTGWVVVLRTAQVYNT